MTNAEIAAHFNELAKLMELHQDNPFKIRSYAAAYNKLRKDDRPLATLTEAELQTMDGIGKAIAGKIHELATTGKMAVLEQFRAQTPPGIQQMLAVRGFGPKKVKAVWDGLGVTTVGQLLYAINENRLVELKGFGAKTQEDLREKLEFYQRSQGQYLYRTLDAIAEDLLARLEKAFPAERFARTGTLRRCCPTLTHLAFVTTLAPAAAPDIEGLEDLAVDGEKVTASFEGFAVVLHCCTAENFGSRQFRYTGAPAFLEAFVAAYPGIDFTGLATEEDVFAKVGLPPIPPELREDGSSIVLAQENRLPKLVEVGDVRGVVHCHSTWSDGIHSVREMAEAARERGFAYLVLTDHSQSAFYANGLKEERVRAQWAEIDELNAELAPFRIFKGIESDILPDGNLDYPDDILAGFEVVIASIHSQLNMDEEKATERLLKAIANPFTTMLGHPTGRLLLSRSGYPIDHRRIIEACAEHGVAIELNANPYRLDMDWAWIPYAVEKGVKISINPDAHSVSGINDIRYGVLAARKGGLRREDVWDLQFTI
ncbi:PHP domain-containing protein [Neolewinella lacunae]|uniref:DNA polymerase/3'-5' exonuclease PolX n=1 Tax=Neolewinella lacunae TaxID=1517758 RepID=A0A923TA56_9BACT|nr:helix-hairpin-helix domain-containing protein [Neolewinella lacunae]MBC6996206.1 DNA polymerase/3'-5' exonuclease PolX [Neolewinella lacunae]MDN3637163.1 PHP domain-containing protein [Neolewinella lacunae]